MGLIRTTIGVAILLLIGYVIVTAIANGYFGASVPFPEGAVPDAWAAPNSWSEWRDIVIVLSFGFFVVAGILACGVMVAMLVLALMARKVLKEHAAPAIDSLKASLDNLAGTTEYVGETVVSPIVRTYAVFRGVRSGVGAITNLPGRIRGRKGRKGRRKK